MGLKSIFDGIYVDQLIQKNERGEFVIYPYGIMGGGYVLPAEREPAMRRRMRLTMLVALILGTTLGVLLMRVVQSENAVSPFAWLALVGIGAPLLFAMIYHQRRLAVGLEPAAGPRPSAREWLRGGRRARPSWTYWFSTIVGLLLALLSMGAIGVGIADGDGVVIASGIFLLAISVFSAWDGLLGLNERRRAD